MRRLNVIIFLLLLICPLVFAQTDQTASVYTEDKPVIMVSAAHPQFTIQLKSNPTTGYSWFLREYDTNFIQPLKHSFVRSPNTKMIGAPGFEVWTFRVKPAAFSVPQQLMVRFVYGRPWEPATAATGAHQVVFKVTTRP